MANEKKTGNEQSQSKPDDQQFRDQHGEPMDNDQVSRAGQTTKRDKKRDEAA
jgi:hypothetical protein